MRTIEENMHAWTLDEVIDQEIGKAGTSERDAFERLCTLLCLFMYEMQFAVMRRLWVRVLTRTSIISLSKS